MAGSSAATACTPALLDGIGKLQLLIDAGAPLIVICPQENSPMPRGVTPRQPSRSGRQEKIASRPLRSQVKVKRVSPVLKTVAKVAAPIAGRKVLGKKEGATAKSYNPLAPSRVTEILKRLDERYPLATCALHHNSAWELLVATILSAQCTDVRVNMVTPVIFAKYPTLESFAALKPEELEPDIRSTGCFRNKAKSVVGAARKLMSDFGGRSLAPWTSCCKSPAWPARPPMWFWARGSRS